MSAVEPKDKMTMMMMMMPSFNHRPRKAILAYELREEKKCF